MGTHVFITKKDSLANSTVNLPALLQSVKSWQFFVITSDIGRNPELFCEEVLHCLLETPVMSHRTGLDISVCTESLCDRCRLGIWKY